MAALLASTTRDSALGAPRLRLRRGAPRLGELVLPFLLRLRRFALPLLLRLDDAGERGARIRRRAFRVRDARFPSLLSRELGLGRRRLDGGVDGDFPVAHRHFSGLHVEHVLARGGELRLEHRDASRGALHLLLRLGGGQLRLRQFCRPRLVVARQRGVDGGGDVAAAAAPPAACCCSRSAALARFSSSTPRRASSRDASLA